MQRKTQQLAVAFVDDISLYSNSEKVEQKIQEIINTYRRLYESKITIDNQQLRQIDARNSIRALSMYITPSLN